MSFDDVVTVVLLILAIIEAVVGFMFFDGDYQRKTWHIVCAIFFTVVATL